MRTSKFLLLCGILLSFSACQKETIFPQAESTKLMCKTSYGDFVSCADLEDKELWFQEIGSKEKAAGYDYKWYSCTLQDRFGNYVAGGQCTSFKNGGCTNAHACTPCGNC
jgi:hypothetical protein